MLETAMTPTSWITLLITFAIAVIVPGPDTFLILRLGVRDRSAALLAACGIMIGNALWTTASVVGLAALMRTLPGALPVMQLLGSAVLLWLGAESLRGGIAGFRQRAKQGAQSAVARVSSRPLRLGLVTNLSNPKALLFFAALFTQLMPADATILERAMIVVALTAIGIAWFLAFAWFTSSARFQRWFGRAIPVLDILAGLVFVAVAGVVLIELATSWAGV